MPPITRSAQKDRLKPVDDQPVTSASRSRRSSRKKKVIDNFSTPGKPSSATETVKQLSFVMSSPVSGEKNASENLTQVEAYTPRRSARIAKKTATPIAKPQKVCIEPSTPSTSSTITSSPSVFNRSPSEIEENTERNSSEEVSNPDQSETPSNWETVDTPEHNSEYGIKTYTSQLVERVARKTSEEMRLINSRNARNGQKPSQINSLSFVSVPSGNSRTTSGNRIQAAPINKQILPSMRTEKGIEGQPSSVRGRNFVSDIADENISRSQLVNMLQYFHQRIVKLERDADEKGNPAEKNNGKKNVGGNGEFREQANKKNEKNIKGHADFGESAAHGGRSSKHDGAGEKPGHHEYANTAGGSHGHNPSNGNNNASASNQGNVGGNQAHQQVGGDGGMNQQASGMVLNFAEEKRRIEEAARFQHIPPGSVSFLLRRLQASFLYRSERSHALLAANFAGLCSDLYGSRATYAICSILGTAVEVRFSRDRLAQNIENIVKKSLPSQEVDDDLKNRLLEAVSNADREYSRDLNDNLNQRMETDLFDSILKVLVLNEGSEQCKKGRAQAKKIGLKQREIQTISVSKPRRVRDKTPFKTTVYPDLLGKVIWRTKELFISNDHTAHYLYAKALLHLLSLKLKLNQFKINGPEEALFIRLIELFCKCLKDYQRGKTSKTMLFDFPDPGLDPSVGYILERLTGIDGINISPKFLIGHPLGASFNKKSNQPDNNPNQPENNPNQPENNPNQPDNKLNEPINELNDQESQPLNSKYGWKDFTPEFFSQHWILDVTKTDLVRENYKREITRQGRDPENEYPDSVQLPANSPSQ